MDWAGAPPASSKLRLVTTADQFVHDVPVGRELLLVGALGYPNLRIARLLNRETLYGYNAFDQLVAFAEGD